jgi:hypothetical protein
MQWSRDQHEQSSCTQPGTFGKNTVEEPLKDPHDRRSSVGPNQRRNKTHDKSYRVSCATPMILVSFLSICQILYVISICKTPPCSFSYYHALFLNIAAFQLIFLKNINWKQYIHKHYKNGTKK